MGMKQLRRTAVSIGIGMIVVLAAIGLAFGAQILILPAPEDVDQTLATLYAADQAVREGGIETAVDVVSFVVGDWLRVNKVRRIVAADLLASPEAYAHAAQILQHGNQPQDYQQAHELSLEAYALGDEAMLRHSALAEDRYLVAIGEPQKYGTQFVCEPPEGWALSPVDPSVTDAERTAVDVEPLADMTRKIAALNEATAGECSLSSETMQQIEAIMTGEP